MRPLRALVRALALATASAAAYATWLLGWPLARALGRTAPWRGLVLSSWSRAVVALLGIRVAVDGTPPSPPFLLVANHLSYLDVIVLASRLRRPAFVAKADVARWPVVGLLARSMGTLFVDRERKRDLARSAGALEERLRRGEGMVLFPEGTSTDGAGVAPFRSSLLDPAARGRLPVSYAALSYATPDGEPPAHLAVCWWGDMTFGDHLLRLLRLASVEAHLTFGAEPVRGSDRKELARDLWQAVRDRFRPVVSTPTPDPGCRAVNA